MRPAETQSIDNVPELTPKEAALLQLLEGNPGRWFSRTYLLSTIWGYKGEVRTRTVDAHVSRLRKKLRGRQDVTIFAVMGRGYVLQRSGGSSIETFVETPVSPARAEDSYGVEQRKMPQLGHKGSSRDDIDEAPGWGVTMA